MNLRITPPLTRLLREFSMKETFFRMELEALRTRNWIGWVNFAADNVFALNDWANKRLSGLLENLEFCSVIMEFLTLRPENPILENSEFLILRFETLRASRTNIWVFVSTFRIFWAVTLEKRTSVQFVNPLHA